MLMSFMYRTADYRHQVLEISAPVQCPAGEDAATAFARCAAEVSAAIARSPAHWAYWASKGDLANLGLLSPDRDEAPAESPAAAPAESPAVVPAVVPAESPAAAPAPLTAKGFTDDESADGFAVRGRPVPATRSRRL
jgi:hypothetical protein